MSFVHQQWEPVVFRKSKPIAHVPVPNHVSHEKELEEFDEKKKINNHKSFGKRVQQIRMQYGFNTQGELAKHINEPVSTITMIESGKVSPQHVITKINSALKLFKTENFLQPPKH